MVAQPRLPVSPKAGITLLVLPTSVDELAQRRRDQRESYERVGSIPTTTPLSREDVLQELDCSPYASRWSTLDRYGEMS